MTGIICKTDVKGDISRSVAQSGMNLISIILRTHPEDILSIVTQYIVAMAV